MGFSIVCNGCRALGPPVLCPGVTSSFAGSSSLLIAVRIWFQKRAGGNPQVLGKDHKNENENEHSELVKANKNRNRNMVTNIDG